MSEITPQEAVILAGAIGIVLGLLAAMAGIAHARINDLKRDVAALRRAVFPLER